eukprot:SAG25_NODE_702_length_5870_cov_4.999653_8_plen_53_part_00
MVSAETVGRKKRKVDNSREARKARGEWTSAKPARAPKTKRGRAKAARKRSVE